MDGKNSTDFIFTTAISSSISSTSTTTVASSHGLKTAFDKANSAFNGLANKLDKTARAADSSKLEAQTGGFYRNANNLNAGNIPVARMPRYRVITANTTLNHGDQALIDMTGGNITVTLPASPSIGTTLTVMDAAGLADAKSLTVGRNGQPIMGVAEDVIFDVPGYKADFIYLNASRGWVLA